MIHKTKLITCPICGIYVHTDHLATHMHNIHQGYYCNLCLCLIPDTLISHHMLFHNKVSCDRCIQTLGYKTFHSIGGIKKHLDINHNERDNILCTHCQHNGYYVYVNIMDYNDHVNNNHSNNYKV